jgi:hypothetical protein
MAKRKYVLRMDEAELEQLPDLPHHHGGWTVRISCGRGAWPISP